RLGGQFRGTFEDFDLVEYAFGQEFQTVEPDEVGRGLHGVHDVIEVGGKTVDVLPVERGRRTLVESAHDGVGGVVTRVLAGTHLFGDGLTVGPVTHHLNKQAGTDDQVVRRVDEQVVVAVITRAQSQAHVVLPKVR